VIIVGLIPSVGARILKQFGVLDKITPASKSAVRMRSWNSREEALTYFKRKALFKNFSKKSLQLYVEHGLVAKGSKFELRFDVPTEVKIYQSVPLNLDALNRVTVPGLIIRGETTDVSRSVFTNRLSKTHGFDVKTVEGGHMFPFENPEPVARLIV
jgi:pimeloyl-ACP methyl ester carboxylesterase